MTITTDNSQTLANALAEIKRLEAEVQRQREKHKATWTQLERVTGLLHEAVDLKNHHSITDLTDPVRVRIDAALSQQAEPAKPRFTDLVVAPSPASGTAPAQDEREAFKRALHSQKVFKLSSATIDAAEWAWFSRPAQTAPQAVKEE